MSAIANILVVDDSPENLLAVEAVLDPLGQRLVLARSGEEALRNVLNEDFALILLDVRMPVLDGLETALLIKQRPRSRYTPIIFLTANDREMDSVMKAYSHGAVDVIFKPFHPEILRSKVSVFVELFAQREQLKKQEEQLRRQAREQAAREEAEQQQRRLHTLFQQMPAIIGVLRAPDQVYVLANPKLHALHGERELLGRTAREAHPELVGSGLLEALDGVFSSGESFTANDFHVEVPGARGHMEDRYFHFSFQPIKGEHGGVDSVIVFAIEQTAHVRARKQAESAERRIAFLADASSVLAASLEYKTTLDAVARLVVPSFADGCAIDLLEEDGAIRRVARADADPAKGAIVRQIEEKYAASVDDAAGIGAVMRTGEPRMAHHVSADALARIARDEEHLRLLRALDLTSTITVPLVASLRVIGALSMAYAESGRSYEEADLSFAQEIARRAAIAVENARLFEAERRAHEHVVRIQNVTAALSEALTPAGVAEVMIGEGMAAMSADACVLYVRPEEDRLELLAARGVPEDRLEATLHLTADDARPAPSVVRTNAASWISEPTGSFGYVPLLVEGRSVGVLGVGFFEGHVFTRGEKDFLETIGRQCAQALERARLYEAQHRAHERLRMLAEASATLGASLDYETTLRNVARLAVPALGDYSFFEVIDDERVVRRVGFAHVDPAMAALLDRAPFHTRRYPDSHPVSRALATGTPQMVANVDDAWLRAISLDEKHLELVRKLGPCSLICLPLITRGKTTGALTLCYSVSQRHYGEDDLRLAEEVAHRAAMAVDNARLFKESQDAIHLRDDFLSIASHELNTPLTPLKMQIAMLRRGIGGAESESKLAMADRQVDRMAKLVSRLLDVSRIVGGRLSLDPELVNLTGVLRDVVGQFREEAAKQGSELVLHADGDAVGSFDRVRVEQVVVNLVTNAIKYGRGQPIDLDLVVEDGLARILVRDRGIGIEPTMQKRIFDRFERAVSSRHYGGFGLGLWIARQIVEASGGRISVESKLGEGSTFSVELPLEKQGAGFSRTSTAAE